MLCDMRLVNTLLIAMYGVMNYSLPMPNFVAFYAKQNDPSYQTGHSEKSGLTLLHETPFLRSVVAQLVKVRWE